MILKKRKPSKFDIIGYYISLFSSVVILFSFLFLIFTDIGLNSLSSISGVNIIRIEFVPLMIISFAISLAFHEIGHYLSNKMYGIDAKFDYEFERYNFRVKTVAVNMEDKLSLNDKQMIVTSFAGPFFNIILLAVSISLLLISSTNILSLFIVCLIIQNYIQAVVNLIPILHNSDGNSILAHYLKSKGHYEEKDFYKNVKEDIGVTRVESS